MAAVPTAVARDNATPPENAKFAALPMPAAEASDSDTTGNNDATVPMPLTVARLMSSSLPKGFAIPSELNDGTAGMLAPTTGTNVVAVLMDMADASGIIMSGVNATATPVPTAAVSAMSISGVNPEGWNDETNANPVATERVNCSCPANDATAPVPKAAPSATLIDGVNPDGPNDDVVAKAMAAGSVN